MKRLFIILAAAMMAVGAMAEGHLKFKGAEMNGTPQEFVNQLIAKGMKLEDKNEGTYALSGSFAGYNDCLIFVGANVKNVNKVVVIIPIETDSWTVIYNNYSSLKEMLATKYGAPTVVKEEWQSTYPPRDDHMRLHELKMNRATFATLYETTEGYIEVDMMSYHMNCAIMLTYVDAINQQSTISNAIEDL